MTPAGKRDGSAYAIEIDVDNDADVYDMLDDGGDDDDGLAADDAGRHGDDRPSKSRRKRAADALARFGAELAALTPTQLEKLPLSPELAAALTQAQAIKARGGRKRQLKYVAKLLRRSDPEPLRAAYRRITAGSRAAVALEHRCERLCSALLAGEPDALDEVLAARPDADRQRLRALARNAARETAQQQAPKSRRQLLRLLRELLADAAPPPAPG